MAVAVGTPSTRTAVTVGGAGFCESVVMLPVTVRAPILFSSLLVAVYLARGNNPLIVQRLEPAAQAWPFDNVIAPVERTGAPPVSVIASVKVADVEVLVDVSVPVGGVTGIACKRAAVLAEAPV